MLWPRCLTKCTSCFTLMLIQFVGLRAPASRRMNGRYTTSHEVIHTNTKGTPEERGTDYTTLSNRNRKLRHRSGCQPAVLWYATVCFTICIQFPYSLLSTGFFSFPPNLQKRRLIVWKNALVLSVSLWKTNPA